MKELAIARDPLDDRRIMPPVARYQRILDVGCGAGQTLVASNLASGVLAVGVDLDHTALSLGKQLSETVLFVRGKGEALPFANDCFELIVCRVALPYMHVPSALGEMWRVLRGGGCLWIVLQPFNVTMSELASSIMRFDLKGALYRLWVSFNGLTLHAIGKQWPLLSKPERYESWQTRRAITRALMDTGFGQIEITRGKHFLVTAIKA